VNTVKCEELVTRIFVMVKCVIIFVTKFRGETYLKEEVVLNLRDLRD